MPPVQVYGPRDATIGTADSASEGAAERASYQARPKLRPGDVVEAVPGVVATQHSGDGKANQYFLRGFNLDHGTDFSLTVDGMPVNMPSHGHGQGYADLNFLIPELVSGVRYRKGPYFAEPGDFSLAGTPTLDYFSVLPRPFAELTVDSNRFRRALLAGSRSQEDQTWLGALELEGNDGPWDTPENLRKANGAIRFSQGSASRGFSVTGMAYRSSWTSTDLVPQRLLDSGELSRFGTLDPTDGGNTRRLSLSGKWFDIGKDGTRSRQVATRPGSHAALAVCSSLASGGRCRAVARAFRGHASARRRQLRGQRGGESAGRRAHLCLGPVDRIDAPALPGRLVGSPEEILARRE